MNLKFVSHPPLDYPRKEVGRALLSFLNFDSAKSLLYCAEYSSELDSQSDILPVVFNRRLQSIVLDLTS